MTGMSLCQAQGPPRVFSHPSLNQLDNGYRFRILGNYTPPFVVSLIITFVDAQHDRYPHVDTNNAKTLFRPIVCTKGS